MNKEQIEGLAKVLDNLGVAAIVAAVAAAAALKIPPWQLFVLLISGLVGVYGGYCLRKLRPLPLPPSLPPSANPASGLLSSTPSSSFPQSSVSGRPEEKSVGVKRTPSKDDKDQ